MKWSKGTEFSLIARSLHMPSSSLSGWGEIFSMLSMFSWRRPRIRGGAKPPNHGIDVGAARVLVKGNDRIIQEGADVWLYCKRTFHSISKFILKCFQYKFAELQLQAYGLKNYKCKQPLFGLRNRYRAVLSNILWSYCVQKGLKCYYY